MNPQLMKGVLDLIILAYIEKEDMHGYLIVQKIQPHIKVKESSIYIVLTRLLQNEYLSSYSDTNGSRNVKMYKITDQGREYLSSLYKNWDEINEFVNATRKDKDE